MYLQNNKNYPDFAVFAKKTHQEKFEPHMEFNN